MANYLVLGLGLVAASIVYLFISSILSSYRHARKARELGCEAPVERQNRLPLAVDLTWQIIKADRENVVPPFFLQTYKEMGRPTWTQNFLGTMAIVTCDPKNIQALLATQFNDFEIGEQRRGNFFPMLGNGIFTTDGKAW